MYDLTGLDLVKHLIAITREYAEHNSVYGYGKQYFFKGFDEYDFCVKTTDKKAATPLGPAAGPHTQMTQNIILSYLHGGRFIELKTIQQNDKLTIPRPCIDMRNIGYNVEWSQELPLAESFTEYLNAWILLHILRDMQVLDCPASDSIYNFVFDISLGYDLQGISSPAISKWLKNMSDARSAIEKQLASLPDAFRKFRSLDIPAQISDTVTLSTFHGCPSDEIESMVKYLIKTHNLHVTIKMNPTLLGYEFVRDLLQNQLGYKQVEPDAKAFAHDLKLGEALEMMRRLQQFARDYGRVVGAKFTNTLVVKNDENIFDGKQRYLSGAPLYMIAMHAMQRFRRELEFEVPVSFSGGIDKHNFGDAVACNLVPVTVCSDLLRKRGYRRMHDYFGQLKQQMEALDVTSIDEYIKKFTQTASNLSTFQAGMINADQILNDPEIRSRYHHNKNAAKPRKIDSELSLLDCLSCEICIPVCPNAANFKLKTGKQKIAVPVFIVKNGKAEHQNDQTLEMTKAIQIANLATFCNACGNCDTFCPESGGPFIKKVRFFLSEAAFNEHAQSNGFFINQQNEMLARIDYAAYRLNPLPGDNSYLWFTPWGRFEIKKDAMLSAQINPATPDGQIIDAKPYFIMKLFYEALLQDPNAWPANILFSS